MLSKELTPSPQRKLVSSETASVHSDVGSGPARQSRIELIRCGDASEGSSALHSAGKTSVPAKSLHIVPEEYNKLPAWDNLKAFQEYSFATRTKKRSAVAGWRSIGTITVCA